MTEDEELGSDLDDEYDLGLNVSLANPLEVAAVGVFDLSPSPSCPTDVFLSFPVPKNQPQHRQFHYPSQTGIFKKASDNNEENGRKNGEERR